MKNVKIDDLSYIQQRKAPEESFMTLEETKKRPNISCPYTHTENYHCPICTRLRAVCPFSKIQTCIHSQPLLNVNQNTTLFSRANNSTMIGERHKTLSTFDSRNHTIINLNNQSQRVITPLRHNIIKTEASVPIIEQIIFVPEIHNRIVIKESEEKLQSNTPTRRRAVTRFIDVSDDVVLTPTQFKDLIHSYRHS